MGRQPVESCTCTVCQAQCKRKPGWFKPGEAEKVAELLGLSLQQFFDRYLMVDSWELDKGSNAVLSPAIKGEDSGVYLAFATGECVFFKDGRCTIHAVKPYECRYVSHRVGQGVHEEVGLAWGDHQKQVALLRIRAG